MSEQEEQEKYIILAAGQKTLCHQKEIIINLLNKRGTLVVPKNVIRECSL